uniref:EF-hand domain-containing protein n=1 Tax=Fibrocapsa japonica TaxID=94617 RepID=A0A7S2V2Y5_9STRA|mmetsp:Transcript_4941/g.7467  ORF Transcript_4941/g.7467 Transcript_4941/m.7467 type:complete len:187 (+) Transcript_4941:200-760(+)|eukprot:CAMPEP_0113942266 /NCGR_PEP_ID=MMETSP1339-20121228/8009_1 /TAXON_ID=94617 /ORGANISM="Fibrocapsa japonica" /LENGTH=186 /DNA_ID=CAMNT_0000946661 /DNA_START=138 /DNA_END=698 /DNA_ORIENTATION=+ /assembly_acc=CAM_ASM_000762
MAFFGLTSLGPQDSFATSLLDTINLNIFSDEDFETAFKKVDRDGSGFIERNEIEALLREVYRGDCPRNEVEMFMAKFDTNQDGKISWEEFVSTLCELRQEVEEQEKAKEQRVGPASQFSSNLEYRENMHKHTRLNTGPTDKYNQPMTASQEYGWQHKEVDQAPRAGKKSCEETLYAAELVKSGMYY